MASTVRPGGKHRFLLGARWWALAALVLVVLGAAVAGRVAMQDTPPLVIHRTLSAYVRLPGSAPVLAWPEEGQAAVGVMGVGSVESSGQLTPVPIASVAKIMTAYLTLREHPLLAGHNGFVLRVTAADVAQEQQRAALGESVLAVRAGELITEREALEALLLPSANNVAVLLAVRDAGSLAAFVARMNSTAKQLGMASTTYTDPSGFQDGTVSTAADQLKLAQGAMRIAAFAAIVGEPSAQLPQVGRVDNYDGLAGRDGYVGVKTGSDRAAGGCLVFAKRVTVAGQHLTVLGVVLGQRAGSLIEAALTSGERLGDSAARALREETVLPAGTAVLSASSSDGRRTMAVTNAPIREVGWGGLTLAAQLVVRTAVAHPSAGDPMATVTVRGTSIASSIAVSTRSVAGPSLGWHLRQLL